MMFILILLSLLFSNTSEETGSYTYYQDTSGTLTLDEIQGKQFLLTEDNNLGVKNGLYWFKINAHKRERSILEIRSAQVENLSLYDSNHKEIGLMSNTRFPSFFLNNKNLSYPLYLKSNFSLSTHFPIHISSEEEFASNDKRSLLGMGFFYGTAIALLFATLIFFIIVRNTQFLFFAVLIGAIVLSVFAKDNILYFFGVSSRSISIMESIAHFIVGLSATGFMMFYLQVRPHQLWIKWGMLSMTGLSLISLAIFLETGNLYAYSILDITTLITIILTWTLILMITKGVHRLVLVGVYSFNLFFLINAFILHTYGLEIVHFDAGGIAAFAIANFTLVATLLLISFKRIQTKGVIMKHRIKLYTKQLKELDNYKNIQDENDEYMESLIYQFKLENIEVKVLDEISKGLSNDAIAHKYSLTEEKLQTITNTLYSKLGLESSQEIGQLAF